MEMWTKLVSDFVMKTSPETSRFRSLRKNYVAVVELLLAR